jgi:hypothetical protein
MGIPQADVSALCLYLIMKSRKRNRGHGRTFHALVFSPVEVGPTGI